MDNKQVLTDERLREILGPAGNIAVARIVESDVLATLQAAGAAEPVGNMDPNGRMKTLLQLHSATITTTHEQPRQDDQGASQDAGADASGAGAACGAGEDKHHEHRARQSDPHGKDDQRHSGGARLSGSSAVRAGGQANDSARGGRSLLLNKCERWCGSDHCLGGCGEAILAARAAHPQPDGDAGALAEEARRTLERAERVLQDGGPVQVLAVRARHLRELASAALAQPVKQEPYATRKLKPQAAAPSDLPDWTDPRVQAVYGILCSQERPPSGEHWEGWIARRIVAHLVKPSPAGGSVLTGNADADLALVLLDRLDVVDKDTARVEQIERFIRRLAALASRAGQADTGSTSK